MLSQKRIYQIDKLPIEEDLVKFAIPYTPQVFSPQEQQYLRPFFSNIDKPVFVIQHLPEEVIGALSSRYSRSTKSLRRMFLDEYIAPIMYPEKQKGWEEMSDADKNEAKQTKKAFLELIDLFNRGGGIEAVVNVQRGRKFFDTWLAQYGDDSIAEMGGIHLSIEGGSWILTKELEDKRVGISPIEKSSRYVQFWDKRSDGEYQYLVPGELKGTKYEKEYRAVMDLLFDTYAHYAEPYAEYIKKLYPKGEDETERSFINSRAAKRFDDIRDLLPMSTQTSFALFGNGRAFEDLINRFLCHPLGEMRWWGKQICEELEKVVPSFVYRPKTMRGAEMQTFKRNMQVLKDEMVKEVLAPAKKPKPVKWVKLLSAPDDAGIDVLSAFLFSLASGKTLTSVRKEVQKLAVKKREALLVRLLEERKLRKENPPRTEMRFRKVPKAFETAHYAFELWARAGDYRDLHRHRALSQDRQLFTTVWGYDLEKEVMKSPFIKEFKKALENVEILYKKLYKFSPYVAQYVVSNGHIQHWYIDISAREIYWLVEIRTGPQGRPHYRQICQQIGQLAKKASPAVFSSLLIDMQDYSLARRESEKKIEKKLQNLRGKREK